MLPYFSRHVAALLLAFSYQITSLSLFSLSRCDIALPHSLVSLPHIALGRCSLSHRIATLCHIASPLSAALRCHTHSRGVSPHFLSCSASPHSLVHCGRGEQQNIYYCRINIGPIVDGRVAVGGITIDNNTVTTMVMTKTATSYRRGQKSNK